MMALSITLASPVAMNPPRLMVSRIGSWRRVPMLASWGNQSRKVARSSGTTFCPVKKLKGALAADRRDQVRQEVVQHLAARHNLGPRRVLTLMAAMICHVMRAAWRAASGSSAVVRSSPPLPRWRTMIPPAARCRHDWLT
jgi:hypothetical protein